MYRLKIGVFAPTGSVWPKISGRRVRPSNHSSSQKTRLNDLSYGVTVRMKLTSDIVILYTEFIHIGNKTKTKQSVLPSRCPSPIHTSCCLTPKLCPLDSPVYAPLCLIGQYSSARVSSVTFICAVNRDIWYKIWVDFSSTCHNPCV